jgi:hypothetical protein
MGDFLWFDIPMLRWSVVRHWKWLVLKTPTSAPQKPNAFPA